MFNKSFKVYTYPYQLKFNSKLLNGSLLCFEFKNQHRGYSDFLAWPKWDGSSLSKQLEDAKKGKFSKRFLIAKHNAFIDAMARSQKQNLFFGLNIPDSHFLIDDILSFKNPKEIFAWDYHCVKVKIKPKNLKLQIDKLKQLAKTMPETIRWRLDFNGSVHISKNDLSFLWKQIDFIEDAPPSLSSQQIPSSFFASDWKTSVFTSGLKTNPIFRTQIIKPSRDSLRDLYYKLARGLFNRVIFTHSFDHPLGQAISAYWAAQFYKNYPRLFEVSGLKCLKFIENDFFFHKDRGPKFQAPTGYGFGFDEILEKQNWKRLI